MVTATKTRRHATERWVWVAGGAAAVGLLALRDPNTAGSYGFCPLLALTGWDCPLCGGLRGTNALLHGDVATALDHNALLPLFLAVAVALAVSAFVRAGRVDQTPSAVSIRSRPLIVRPVVLWWSLGVVTAVFFVVRNLPWFPYLDSVVR
ncbi:MAG: DUF2752 domain-containing protein [Actinomycetes bacterium]